MDDFACLAASLRAISSIMLPPPPPLAGGILGAAAAPLDPPPEEELPCDSLAGFALPAPACD